jgi:NAD(P)-dependent dehydrogenase (short-subunit alcohol dehydrogenase family)
MERIAHDFEEIRGYGVQVRAFNGDALSRDGRHEIMNALADHIQHGKVRTILHSIALGNLKPLVVPPSTSSDTTPQLAVADEEDFAQTIYNMGTNILFWVQDLHGRGMFAPDARVLGLTSEGNEIAWSSYAPVSAAKSALESLARSIAKEFAPYGIRCNVIQPGVTDTPALRMIPGSDKMKSQALVKNPFGRLTTPEDVANVVDLMSRDEAAWINGAIIRVDGGEHISG